MKISAVRKDKKERRIRTGNSRASGFGDLKRERDSHGSI